MEENQHDIQSIISEEGASSVHLNQQSASSIVMPPRGEYQRIKLMLNSVVLFLTVIFLYMALQLNITMVELISRWQQPSFYIVVVLCQYLIHLIFAICLFRDCIRYIGMINMQIYVDELVELVDAFHGQQDNSKLMLHIMVNYREGQYRLNKYIFIWMFVLANLMFFEQKQRLDLWFYLSQLLIGWLVLLTIGILFLVSCIAVPFYVYWIMHQIEQQRRRRVLELIGRSNDQPVYVVTMPQARQYKELAKHEIELQPCYICLQEFGHDDRVIQLNCHPTHIFHEDCLVPWTEAQGICPVCRAPL